jgi:chromosome segregation ATPase
MSTIDANNKNDYNNCTYDSEEDNYFRKSYSNTLYLRTFNNFHKNPRIRIIKNKTLKKYKIKHPSLTKSLKQKTKNSIFNPSYSLLENEQNNKDTLFLEVIQTQNNIQNMNSKLKNIKSNIYFLERGNLINMHIMENVLNELKDKDDDKAMNNKKKKKIQYEENTKINVLKKQINLYDLTIQRNDMKLNELKNREKPKKYQEVINLLYNKDKEIFEINGKFEEINNILLENDTRINYYNIRTQQYNNDIYKLEKKLRYNNEMIYENGKEINLYNEKKENLKNDKKKLIDKIKIREKEIDDINKVHNSYNKEIELNKGLLKEKEKNEIMINNLKTKHEKIKSDINKMEKKLKILKYEYNNYINEVTLYDKEWPEILEKSKIPGRNQEKMRWLEKEIEKISNEMKKRNEDDTNKEKAMSDKLQEMIELNDNYKNEIDYFESEKNEIITKLNELKVVMENNKNINETLKQECANIEKIIEKNKEEYTKKKKEDEEKRTKKKLEKEEKEKQFNIDKELKEKNFKEAENKYNEEIKILKEKNALVKKQKEELQKKYDDKMKELKLFTNANSKLKMTLEEIEKLSPVS